MISTCRRGLSGVVAIALNTFRETIRDRVLYGCLVFAFVITSFGLILGNVSVGQDLRILEDFGLAAISIIGALIAVLVGVSLVYKEIELRTIYLIVTKPIARWQFVVGKFLGLCLSVLVCVVIMGAFLLGLVALSNPFHVVNPLLLEALALIYLELVFTTALATFFSTFATPVMSMLFTGSLWMIAHSGQSLRELGRLSANPLVTKLFDSLYWVMPDLARLTQIRGDLMYGRQPDGQLIVFLLVYILAYTAVLLSFATLIMEEREFA